MKMCYVGVLFALSIGLLSACGKSSKNHDSMKANNDSDSLSQGRELIEIPIGIQDHDQLGLTEGLSNFLVEAVGCQSSYQPSATLNSPSLKLYLGDTNCVAKLEIFYLGSAEYRPVGIPNFALNNTVTFKGTKNEGELTVKVVSQLNSPISASESVVFEFSQVQEHEGAIVHPIYNPTSVSVNGGIPPEMSMQAQYVGLVAGFPQLQFTLHCTAATSSTSEGPTSCGSNLYSDMKYALVRDPSNGSTDPLPLSFFQELTTPIATSFDSAQFIADDYQTIITGPGKIINSDNYLLLIIKTSMGSYSYYRIRIAH